MRRISILLFLLISFLGNTYSQSVGKDKVINDKYGYIFDLIHSEMYNAALSEIRDLVDSNNDLTASDKTELDGYSLICSILMEKANVDGLVKDFETNYPYSGSLSLIRFYYSEYYFKRGDYSRSLDIMKKIEGEYLYKDLMYRFIFNRAYCNLRVGNNLSAADGFKKIVSLDVPQYVNPSNYYLGYIHYLTKDFSGAIPYFVEVENSQEFGMLAQYYILESNLMLKKYDDVTSRGEILFRKMDDVQYINDEEIQNTRNKVARILSEAYYAKDMVREAKDYMDLYSASVGNLSRKENYYLGVVAYALNSYYSAIDALSKVTPEADSISQSADFFIGSSYLMLKNKVKALEFYKSASESSVDLATQEEAYFNYAKLTFDLYRNINVFESYIDKYTSTERGDEIYHYISTAYLLSKDYKSAIDVMSKIKVLEPSMIANFQKATFFRAMDQFKKGAYNAAITNFQLSHKNSSQNVNLKNLTEYWMAEAYYRLHEYQQSSSLLSSLILDLGFQRTSEYNTSLYNLGYSYFNGEDFLKAIEAFNKYLSVPPSQRIHTREAQLRLADSYFMLNDYDRASELYSLVSTNAFDKDDIYAFYQGAVSYGLLGNIDRKIEILSNVTVDRPNSPLYTMSMYELGRSYVQVQSFDKAKKCFNSLLGEVSDSLYYSKSLLELGMIYSNEANYKKAYEYFDLIVKKMPYSAEAQNALVGLESIFQMQNKPDEYIAYLDAAGMSFVKSDKEKEQMYFNSAEQQFLNGDFPAAYAALSSFIEKYPDGDKLPQVYFYLGETLAKLKKPEDAIVAYKMVMDMGEGAFAELATLYYATLCYSMEDYDEANMAYETLYSIAKLDNNKYDALLGIMRTSYYGKEFNNAISAANKLLAVDGAREKNGVEADYIIAKSYLAIGDRDAALPILEKLALDALEEAGAESAYILIQYKYDEGDFEAVEEKVYAFADTKTPHNYWLAKSFIVLGDSFADREEWDQAQATFESVRDGYSPVGEKDDVLEQVAMRLEKIKSRNEVISQGDEI